MMLWLLVANKAKQRSTRWSRLSGDWGRSTTRSLKHSRHRSLCQVYWLQLKWYERTPLGTLSGHTVRIIILITQLHAT